MLGIIGIRKEDKDIAERRAPLSPPQVKMLIDKYDLDVVVEPAENRIYANGEYESAGAVISEKLDDCNIIFGVKEIPIERILSGKTYCFFSHTIKGQPNNIPMLQHILNIRSTLIDYEKITDANGRRLIFFGRFAGAAGMVRSLWAFGQRLLWEGITTPFAKVKRAYEYNSLEEAKNAIKEIGEEIGNGGLHQTIVPLICGFAGYGNVSIGAQEIYNLLPYREISPEQLQEVFLQRDFSNNYVYKVVFREKDIVIPVSLNQPFELLDYYQHPHKYQSRFSTYIPFLSILINAIYWESHYPRLVTVEYLKKLFEANKQPRLRVIGDISCDIKGSVECTVEIGDFDKPVYVFDPKSEKIQYGWEGTGPVILALDRLPNEFAKEATESFGEAILPFFPELASCDFNQPFDQLVPPDEFKKAIIAHQGELTPSFRYLDSILREICVDRLDKGN